MVTLVDDIDFNRLIQYKWHVLETKNTCYAVRTKIENGKKHSIRMHRQILSVSDQDIHVDHRDGNGLNNQRDNIRLCTCAENQRNRRAQKNNSSGFKGVTWDKRDRKWKAYIRVNKKYINLGYFNDKNDAAATYDDAAKKYHCEFARLNFSQNKSAPLP